MTLIGLFSTQQEPSLFQFHFKDLHFLDLTIFCLEINVFRLISQTELKYQINHNFSCGYKIQLNMSLNLSKLSLRNTVLKTLTPSSKIYCNSKCAKSCKARKFPFSYCFHLSTKPQRSRCYVKALKVSYFSQTVEQ